ncbi:MAG: hypothetical protein M2R45_03041 [Verrucomicrobia subdivision 3 bacterium]|nr:hypothetical protein [Limisphaerales bacterium]MCS1415562.1 hypothetical protein [Limisphaerales bacterium]
MIRCRKSDVKTERSERADHNRLVEMTQGQWDTYTEHKLLLAKPSSVPSANRKSKSSNSSSR